MQFKEIIIKIYYYLFDAFTDLVDQGQSAIDHLNSQCSTTNLRTDVILGIM